mgnify:CR=1 FL=1
MATKGVFGYIIGKKKRMMKVSDDADLLWQIGTREIYLLMNKYKTKEALEEAFSQIKVINPDKKKGFTENELNEMKQYGLKLDFNNIKPVKKPKFSKEELERIKYFTDYGEKDEYNLRFCEGSFINILEANYIIKEPEEYGYVFLLDFNKGEVRYYKKEIDGKMSDFDSAKIEEIMAFEDMPTKVYDEIINNMHAKFDKYYTDLSKVRAELDKLYKIKQNNKEKIMKINL